MGGICIKTEKKQSSDQGPDTFAGLTKTDKELINKTWHKITNKESLAKVGFTFFVKLFTIYPYLQDYFTFLQERPIGVVHCLHFRSHVMKFMYAITAFVENMDDPETLESLMTKIAEVHCRRNITYDDMQRMKEVFFEFLQDSLGKECRPDVINAWDKLFTAFLHVYAGAWTKLHVPTQQ